MKLSMKSRYGLRALIDLSVNSKNEQVALGGIAERNNISPQYLEQVFASLRKAGIVKSIKGSQGGYFLNKPAEQIIYELAKKHDKTSILKKLQSELSQAEKNSQRRKEIARAIQLVLRNKEAIGISIDKFKENFG